MYSEQQLFAADNIQDLDDVFYSLRAFSRRERVIWHAQLLRDASKEPLVLPNVSNGGALFGERGLCERGDRTEGEERGGTEERYKRKRR